MSIAFELELHGSFPLFHRPSGTLQSTRIGNKPKIGEVDQLSLPVLAASSRVDKTSTDRATKLYQDLLGLSPQGCMSASLVDLFPSYLIEVTTPFGGRWSG